MRALGAQAFGGNVDEATVETLSQIFDTRIVSPKCKLRTIGLQRFVKVLIRVNLIGVNGILTSTQVCCQLMEHES